MSIKDDRTEGHETQRDSYDAAVMQFLDQEITTTSKKAADSKVQVDDVEALVEDLLKESMNEPETAAADQDTGAEDLDRLFSRIFKEYKPALHAELSQALPVVESQLNEALKEIGFVDRQSADMRPADLSPKPQPAAAAAMEITPPSPAVSRVAPPAPAAPAPTVSTVASPAPAAQTRAVPTVASPAPAPPPVLQAIEKETTREPDAVYPVRDELQKTLLFALPAQKRFWNMRIAVITGAFVCLLAGAGIVILKNPKKTVTDNSGQPADSLAAAAAPEVAQPAVVNPPPSPAVESKPPAARPVRNAGSPTPVAPAHNSNAVVSGAPPKDGKSTPVTPSAPPPAGNAPADATVTADAAGKPASTAVSAVDTPAANPPQRAAEVTPPPPVLRTQPAPEPALAPLIPKASANLEDPATAKRPAFQPPTQPPVTPKRTTPAVVISRVLPSYPELARKSRITGTVVVDVQVDERGRVTKATAVSGPAILRVEAVNAVLRWQFRPANVEGTPVPSSSQVSIVFK